MPDIVWFRRRDSDPDDVDELDLPVASGEPYVGAKAVTVTCFDGVDGRRVAIAPLLAGGLVDPESAAICHHHHHPAPHPSCRCGFNVFGAVDDARRYAVRCHIPRHAVAQVELSGTIVEHESGARGEFQRILGVSWPPVCWGCGSDARMFAEFSTGELAPSHPRLLSATDVDRVGPSCGSCGSDPRTPATLAGQLGVGCRLDDRLDPDVVESEVAAVLKSRRRAVTSMGVMASLLAAMWLVLAVVMSAVPSSSVPGDVAALSVGWRHGTPTRPLSSIDGTATYLGTLGGVGLYALAADDGTCRRVAVTGVQTVTEYIPTSDDPSLALCAAAVARSPEPVSPTAWFPPPR